MVLPVRFERTAYALEEICIIYVSYWKVIGEHEEMNF
jgi:hypothetical protein